MFIQPRLRTRGERAAADVRAGHCCVGAQRQRPRPGADRRGAFAHSRSARPSRTRRHRGGGCPPQIHAPWRINARNSQSKSGRSEHPGWPAGTEGGRGGRFRPKDGAEAVIAQDVIERIQRIKARRALRTEALAVLRLAAELLVDAVPGIGLAADAATLIDMANTIAELKKLKVDADAAIEFVKHGPYSLDELQVSSNYEEFSSYGDFIKDAAYLALLVKRFGRAGSGNQYHHIVTQGGANGTKIPPGLLQNTDNVIPLPTLVHEALK